MYLPPRGSPAAVPGVGVLRGEGRVWRLPFVIAAPAVRGRRGDWDASADQDTAVVCENLLPRPKERAVGESRWSPELLRSPHDRRPCELEDVRAVSLPTARGKESKGAGRKVVMATWDTPSFLLTSSLTTPRTCSPQRDGWPPMMRSRYGHASGGKRLLF
jgi:hypothetical protein